MIQENVKHFVLLILFKIISSISGIKCSDLFNSGCIECNSSSCLKCNINYLNPLSGKCETNCPTHYMIDAIN